MYEAPAGRTSTSKRKMYSTLRRVKVAVYKPDDCSPSRVIVLPVAPLLQATSAGFTAVGRFRPRTTVPPSVPITCTVGSPSMLSTFVTVLLPTVAQGSAAIIRMSNA